MTSPAPANGYDNIANALGMSPPRPRLRVVQPGDQAPTAGDTGVWRPANLDEYIGQTRAQLKVKMWVTSAMKRDMQPGHVLLSGPPGLGKTTLAAIIAALMNDSRPESDHVAFHVTTGDAISSPQQMAKQLSKLREGDVLAVDECHQMGRKAEEMLGLGMEDGRITIPGNKSGTVDAVTSELPKFTLVGATTRPAHLSQPLRDRFGLSVSLEYYADEELTQIVARKAARDSVQLTDEAAAMIAGVGRQTPRKALGALTMVSAYADTIGATEVDAGVAAGAFQVMGLDSLGLDERDRDYCDLIASFGGQRVGLKSLAAASGLDQREISDDIEPYLMRTGLVDIAGNRGRSLTKRAWSHLYPDVPCPVLGA